MPTCCLRGGCLTGPNHSGVELHGFLSYLVRCNVEGRVYTIFGYKGKQVRDNIHSLDVATFINCFIKAPRCAEVYNIGGGRENSISIIEAFSVVENSFRKADAIGIRGHRKERRSHMLHLRPVKNENALSAVEDYKGLTDNHGRNMRFMGSPTR